MVLNIASFIFNMNVDDGKGTPTWGTEMGQNQEYKYSFENMNELLVSMLYKKIPDENIKQRVWCPLGKGGSRQEDYNYVMASLFDKIYVNDVLIEDAKFILLIVEQINSESGFHIGRKNLKYNPRITFDGINYNEDCINKIIKKFNLTEKTAWLVDEINAKNQDELHLRMFIVNEDEMHFENSEKRKEYIYDHVLFDFSDKAIERFVNVDNKYFAPAVMENVKSALNDDNINELLSDKKCKQYFNLNYSLLKEIHDGDDANELQYEKNGIRYYSPSRYLFQKNERKFLLCNDWYNDNNKSSSNKRKFINNMRRLYEGKDMTTIENEEIEDFKMVDEKDMFKKYYFDNINRIIQLVEEHQDIELRARFNQEYPLARLKEMTIEEYAMGRENYKETLSYKLEFGEYAGMIGIGGSTAKKHGAYWNKNGVLVINGIEVNEDVEEKWNEFRNQLYSFLMEYAEINDSFKTIDKYPMLKGMGLVLTKLLFLYYPEKFISIASKGKLIELLDYFGFEYDSTSQAEELNFALCKNLKNKYDFINGVDSQCVGNLLWEFVNNEINSVDYDEENNEEHDTYSEKEFLEEVFIDKEELDNLLKLIKYSKNIILQGAPGVGKTYIAKRLAFAFMGEKNEDRVLSIQFHQSYSYEEFIEGIRPDQKGDFRVVPGAFKDFCDKARKSTEPYFCIIDEINRGNISKILGELMMLIEKDKRGEKHTLVLPYSKEKFYVPENIYIIGTMNTADRSIAVIDYALRRRFAFYNNKPYFNNQKFIDYINTLNSEKLRNLINLIRDGLNKDITEDESLGEGFLIGHSYFCGLTNEDIDTRLSQIVNYEIIPSLREYWFDNDEKYNNWKRQLKGAINE